MTTEIEAFKRPTHDLHVLLRHAQSSIAEEGSDAMNTGLQTAGWAAATRRQKSSNGGAPTPPRRGLGGRVARRARQSASDLALKCRYLLGTGGLRRSPRKQAFVREVAHQGPLLVGYVRGGQIGQRPP